MRGRMASKALAKKNYESRVRSSPKGMQGNSRQGAAQWLTNHQYYSTFLQIQDIVESIRCSSTQIINQKEQMPPPHLFLPTAYRNYNFSNSEALKKFSSRP